MAGAIFGTAVFPKLYKRTKASMKEAQRHLIKPYELAKAELESLKFEKSLLQEAITRIYEAVQEGRIDAAERDRLLLKYKHQLAIYNEKIDALLPIVDFSELSDMRDDVVNLLEKRITAIDQQLHELSKTRILHNGFSTLKSKSNSKRNSSPVTERNRWQQEQELAEVEEETRKNEIDSHPLTGPTYYASHIQCASGHEDKKHYNVPYKRESTSELISEGKNIERVQNEIMEALSRLEQTGIDINNDNDYNNGNVVSYNNNKENNFAIMNSTSETTDKSCLRQLIKN